MFSQSVMSNFGTPCYAAHQASLSMGFFFRQEYWSGVSFPPPGNLSEPGIKPTSSVSPALAGGFFTTEPRGKPLCVCVYVHVYILYIQHLLLPKHKDWERGNTKMRKEEIKPSSFTDDILTYIEQLKKLTEIIWNQLDECNIFTGYKVNTQKAVTLLYTSNEQVVKTWN